MRFEDIPEDNFTNLKGGSEQVLSDALLINQGQALTEPDLFTKGIYPLHIVPGVYSIFAKKHNDKLMEIITKVEDRAIKNWEIERQSDIDANEMMESDLKCKLNVPPWILAEILFKYDVTPETSGGEFQKIVKTHYSRCWLGD